MGKNHFFSSKRNETLFFMVYGPPSEITSEQEREPTRSSTHKVKPFKPQ